MTVEPLEQNGKKVFKVKRFKKSGNTWVPDLREVVVTNHELYIADLEYIFEFHEGTLERLRESGY